MLYRTEMHCHTSEVSYCADENIEETVEQYINAGATTIVLTNHMRHYAPGFEEENYALGVKCHIDTYKKMKEYAKGRLNILLGAELSLSVIEDNDYLLYGLTEEFLLINNNLINQTLESLSKLCKNNNIIIVQAHPFRTSTTIPDNKYIDGIEVFNGSIVSESHNDIADTWANYYNFIKTAGSDHHAPHHTTECGIITEYPITTNDELLKTLRSGTYSLSKTETPAMTRPY